jgi:hypothetical protein
MSKASQKAWLKPKAWYPAWRVRSAMQDYPVYEPPNPHNEIELPANKAKENFDYFLRQRSARLQYFRDFMKKFGIDAETTDDCLKAVSDWFVRYGGLLLHFQPRDIATLHAFMNYDPPWTGEHVGTNVVWDLGTYIGECVIARRPRGRWDLNTGNPDPISLEAIGFQRPCVSGLVLPTYCDPITQVFNDSQFKSRGMRLGYGRGMTFSNLIDHVAVWSHAAPPNPTLTEGDSLNSSTTPTPGHVAKRDRRPKPRR